MTPAPFTKRLYGKPRRGVIFYFCGWKTPFRLYRPAFFLMNLAGYGVHAYSLGEDRILAFDNVGFMKQLSMLITDVEADIGKLEAQGVHFFATFGNSLGSELALAVTKQVPLISAAILNTVRGSTSEFIWHSPYGRSFKPGYESQGYTEARMFEELKPVEATYKLHDLEERPVLLYYSKADSTIPPHNTELLIIAMANAHVRHHIVKNKYLNHFMASAKNHLYFWTWLSFLRDVESRFKTHS